jgi:hypothetical protein
MPAMLEPLPVFESSTPGRRVRVLVGPTRAATGGSDDFALQRRFDGWPVVILPGKFPLGAGGDFYVKVRPTPGGAASGGAEDR